MKIKIKSIRSILLMTFMVFSVNQSFADTKLSLLIDNGSESYAIAQALTNAYTKENPDVSFEIEIRPGGSDGDNIVKTRLFTEEMTDIFLYDSGALFQALKPSRTLEPVNDISNFNDILPSYIKTVSDAGKTYGVPVRAAMGGGFFYNLNVYKELGLSVPKTWDDFIKNSLIVKEKTDIVPVVFTFKDAWTAQLPILSDFYNVITNDPEFDDNYTKNKDSFSKNKYALKGFKRIEQLYNLDLMNEYYNAATYNDGIKMLAEGKAAHYSMLTFALSTIRLNSPQYLNDVGFFSQPGDDAEKNGLTVWMPAAYYISKSSNNKAEAKKFLNFIAQPKSCDLITKVAGATGPYLIKGCSLPENVPQALKDMLPYFSTDAGTAPALEFLSPVKGPALQQLAVEVGSGMRSAESAAEVYDQDVKKQAKQLRLPNW